MTTNKNNDQRIFRVLKQAVNLTILLGLAAAILISIAQQAQAASQIDQTFGTAGKVVTDFEGNFLNDLAIQADGKIVAVGGGSGIGGSAFAVVRYNVNGTLDTTFDGDGKVKTTAQNLNQAYAVAIQPDGKIVVGGLAIMPFSFALARYNANGSLDTTFDADGIVVSPQAGRLITDIVIQPDGKIVTVGASLTNPTDFAVARYNSNGSLDTTFGNGFGYVFTSITDFDVAKSVAIQTDGKIVVVGESSNTASGGDYGFARYNVDGTLDTTFDSDGVLRLAVGTNDTPNQVLVQPDGKIIAAGKTDGNQTVIRLLPSGALDPAFSSDGIAGFDFGGEDACTAAALQPDGKIVLAGYNDSRITVARFNSNGLPDINFHGDGELTTVIQANEEASAVAIQPDGKILVGAENGNFGLIRFMGDPRFVQKNSLPIEPVDRSSNANPPGIPPTNYPSNISISGARGTITKVRVTLHNITHGFPRDLDVLLVGPQGQQTILMSDVAGGFTGAFNHTLTFDQSAVDNAQFLLQTNGGTYKPFNNTDAAANEPNGIDVFPAPGPGSANYGAANLDVFNGTNPNGVWKLYVVDDSPLSAGGINDGWSLDITTTTSRLNNLVFDYDGDGKTDLGVFRPSNSTWYLTNSGGTSGFLQFGIGTDKIVPADYDGDGRTDIAVYRNGIWYLNRSTLGFTGIQFGTSTDIPMPADFDGDGRADLAVFRPSDGIWYLDRSTAGFTGIQFGTNGDVPAAADYDGDGKADLGVFRSGTWYLQRSTLGFTGIQFGLSGDKPVPADYDADSKVDVAVFRPSNGTWYLQRSQLGFSGQQFGLSTDIPIAADYDGDGRADIAVFRPSNGTWYVQATTFGFTFIPFGTDGDKPVPSAYVP